MCMKTKINKKDAKMKKILMATVLGISTLNNYQAMAYSDNPQVSVKNSTGDSMLDQ